MQTHNQIIKRYMLKVEKQLKKRGYNKEDRKAVLDGLQEHVQEEIWQLENNGAEIRQQTVEDILSNLDLPDDIATLNPEHESLDDKPNPMFATLSLALSLLALPVFYVLGYVNPEIAFDTLTLFSILAVLLALIGLKSNAGKSALFTSLIPLAIVVFFFIAA